MSPPMRAHATFTFGHQGKPYYVPGPTEAPQLVRRRFEHLTERLGPDGFLFSVEADDLEDKIAALDDEFDELEGGVGYDPDEAPDPKIWLALDDDDRSDRVQRHHRRAGIEVPNQPVHAALHVVVENQAAMGDEFPVRRAIDRLMAQGLSRHEAVHAIGSTFLDEVLEPARTGAKIEAYLMQAYKAAVERLTVDEWRRKYADEPDEE